MSRSLLPLLVMGAVIVATAIPFSKDEPRGRATVSVEGLAQRNVQSSAGVGAVLGRSAAVVSAKGSTPSATATPLQPLIVAANGRPTAAGTLADPIDLATALSGRRPITPGSTVYLRGGVYHGAFVSELNGSPASPVVVRSYPHEWAVIDGGTIAAAPLDVKGHDVWFRDFEVMKSDPDRRSAQTLNKPTDNSRGTWSGIWVTGARTKLIDLVVHDNGDGIGMWDPAVNSEIDGCIIFNNGWVGADHPWGHGIYVQNLTGVKQITNNVIFNNYGYGVHAYAHEQPLKGEHLSELTSFGNGDAGGVPAGNIIIGSVQGGTDDISLTDSVMYHAPDSPAINATIGYPESGIAQGSVLVDGNRFIGGATALLVRGWSTATVTRNVIEASTSGTSHPFLASLLPPHLSEVQQMSTYSWDANSYMGYPGAAQFTVTRAGSTRSMSFDRWRSQTGFDQHSTDGPPATPLDVHVHPDRYAPGRAFITIIGDGRASVAHVNLGSIGLRTGESFVVLDVQNLTRGPISAGTYRGQPISLPLVSEPVLQPIGETAHRLSHTSRAFETYLVVPR